MTEFKREDRYIVIKRKHLDASTEGRLRSVLYDLDISTVECVVVEEDWPIYEETWENVQRFAEGRPSIKQERDSLQSQLSEEKAKSIANTAELHGISNELSNQLFHAKGDIKARDMVIANLKDGVRQLEQQLSEARANIERLRKAIEYSNDYLKAGQLNTIGHGSKAHHELDEALKETPAQSLSEIRAQAFMAGQADCGVDPSYSSAMEYAARLRQQGKG